MMKNLKRIKAGVLYYVLVVSFIITLTSFSLLIILQYKRQILNTILKKEEVLSNANSAMYYALAHFDEVDTEAKEIEIFEGVNAELQKEYWGVYEILSTQTKWKSFTANKKSFIGSYIPEKEKVALYVPDKNEGVISFSGKTRVKGKISVPKGRIERGNVAGKAYMGQKLFQGDLSKSSSNLPAINSDLLQHLNTLTQNIATGDSIIPYQEVEKTRGEILNSFSNSPIYLYQKEGFEINRKVIKGKVIIKSDEYIEIDKSATLEDVLIVAPKIYINGSVDGTFQCVAQDTLILESGCKLRYPSALALIANEPALLEIGKDSKVLGGVLMYSTYHNYKSSILNIEKNALVAGIIYNNTYTQCYGEINGSLYTQKMYYKSPSGNVYENAFVDIEINPIQLPKVFCFPTILEEDSKYYIMKWLQ